MSQTDVRIIDAHQHFWSLKRSDYGWLTEDLGILYRDYAPQDLVPLLAAWDIGQTVLVQAAPTIEETRYLLSLADDNEFIGGVVGWVDLSSASAQQEIEQLANHPKFKGVRPMLQDLDDPDWIADPALAPAIDALLENDLSFDALILTQHIDPLREMLSRHPGLNAVVDHGAKPPIASGSTTEWAAKIAQLAEETSVFCKVSGLVTEADHLADTDVIRPVFQHLLSCFGDERLMWGSDWPVLRLRMEYDAWISMTHELLSPLPQAAQEAILSHNAARFYSLRT